MLFKVPDQVREPLHAIVPYYNPWRWTTRVKHTERALKHFHDSGAIIVFVEIAYNRRDPAFANYGLDGTLSECKVHDKEHRHKHITLITKDELWLKENAINIGVGSLPYDWKQVCWLDSDVHFLRPNWVGECIHRLQHYKFVQMFSHARDVDPSYTMLPEDYPHANGIGFAQAFIEGKLEDMFVRGRAGYYGDNVKQKVMFPGLAWACTRQAWDEVGGLIDFAIWGGGDWHMAWALVENYAHMMRGDLHPNYKAMVNAWAARCKRHIRKNIGVMDGSIIHHWHGPKTGRGYNVKHKLLTDIGFDPVRMLKRDYQGLWQLHDDGSDAFVKLRDLMRQIAVERNEDDPNVSLPMDGQGH